MEFSLKWIAIGAFLFEIPFIACYYPEYIVEDLCRKGNENIVYNTSNIGSVATLKATSRPPYQPNKHCTIVIQPPPGLGVVVTIRKIDFRQPSFECLDYLKIFHSEILFSPTTLCRFKFDLSEKLSYYSKGRMEMIYHVESKLRDGLGIELGFALTFTIVSEALDDCLKDDIFMCNNGRCIPDSLTCDAKNNCGDSSDESRILCDITPTSRLLRLTNIMYALVICIFVFIMVFSCVVVSRRRRSRKHETDSASDFDEPTARLTPYQAVHPSGFFICQNPAGPATPYFQHSKIMQADEGFTNPCYPSGMPQAPPPYTQ